MDALNRTDVWDRVAAELQDTVPPARGALSRRLASLQRGIERAYPLSLALDLVDPRAIDALPAARADALHALIEEAVLNAARHAKPALIRVGLQLTGGTARLSVEDDGAGFPFAGVYDLGALAALDVGPLWLMRHVAALGGTLTLDTSVAGTRIDFTVATEAMPVLLASRAA